MSITKDFIIEQLKEQIAGFKAEIKEMTVETVMEVGDGIAKISGLSDVMSSEMLEFKIAKSSDFPGAGGGIRFASVGNYAVS